MYFFPMMSKLHFQHPLLQLVVSLSEIIAAHCCFF